MTEGITDAQVRADFESVINALRTMDKVKPLGDLVYEVCPGGWVGHDPTGYKEAVAHLQVIDVKYR